ncbi:MAG: hypothetical protein QXR87_05470 [Candidatus Hadarchaeales archaeon]
MHEFELELNGWGLLFRPRRDMVDLLLVSPDRKQFFPLASIKKMSLYNLAWRTRILKEVSRRVGVPEDQVRLKLQEGLGRYEVLSRKGGSGTSHRETKTIPSEQGDTQTHELELPEGGNLLSFVRGVLEKRIKRDEVTKLSVFFTGLSAYTGEPINLFLKGESSIGKSYNAKEALRHFPAEDIWFLGGLSPKALVHQHGTILTPDGRRIEDLVEHLEEPKKEDYGNPEEYERAREKWEEARKAVREAYTLVDMSRKILVFLESPDEETLRVLFPILSHDKKEIEYRFTDKTSRGKLTTSRVVIRGWPAAIFLTTDNRRHIEDLATRSFTVSPEAGVEKIREANKLISEGAAFPWKLDEDEEDRKLRKLLLLLRDQTFDAVIIPFPNLHEEFPSKAPRDMRDFDHFCQLVKSVTFLNSLKRPVLKKGGRRYLLATAEDVLSALSLYVRFFHTTRTGTEEEAWDFYNRVVKKLGKGTIREFMEEYARCGKRKSRDWIEAKMHRFLALGYVDREINPDDKRSFVWHVIGEEETPEIISRPAILEERLKGKAREWVRELCKDGDGVIFVGGEETAITAENEERVLHTLLYREGVSSDISNYPKNAENAKIGEKIAENAIFGESRTIQNIRWESPSVKECSVHLLSETSICTSPIPPSSESPLSPVPAPQSQEGGAGTSGSPPSFPPAPPETPAPPPQEEGGLWLVKFTETYPGGLVGSLPREIPKGACRVLTGWEVGELRRKFGFIEVRKLDSIFNNQSNVQSSPSNGELIEVLMTYDKWRKRNLSETEGPPHGTTQLVLEFIRKKAPRPGMRVRMEELRAWADSIGIPNERLREVLQFLESQGFLRLLKEGSM